MVRHAIQNNSTDKITDWLCLYIIFVRIIFDFVVVVVWYFCFIRVRPMSMAPWAYGVGYRIISNRQQFPDIYTTNNVLM